MKQVLGRAGGLVMLVLGLSAVAASAQDRLGEAPVAPKLLFSLEGAAGPQVYYRGSMQSIAFGFAPTRSLTLLVSAERSYVADKIERYVDGYSSERGGTEQFVSAELRYAFFLRKRVSPYVLGGSGAKGGPFRARYDRRVPAADPHQESARRRPRALQGLSRHAIGASSTRGARIPTRS